MKVDQRFHQLQLTIVEEEVAIIMVGEVEAIIIQIIILLGQDICILLQLMHILQLIIISLLLWTTTVNNTVVTINLHHT